MAQRPVRKSSVPSHPFEALSLPEWIVQLQQAANPEHRYRALQAVAFLTEPAEAGRWQLNALGDTDSSVRALAGRLLGKSGPLVDAAPLQQALADADPDVRFEVARTLVRWRVEPSGPAIAALVQLLDEAETQPLMTAAIVESLRSIPTGLDELTARLATLLVSEQAEVREEASAACLALGPAAAPFLDQLIVLADDEEPLVREQAAQTLGLLGVKTPAVLEALQAAAADEDELVAAAASASLQKLGV